MYKRKKDVSMSDHNVYRIIIFALPSLVSVMWRPHHYWVNKAHAGVWAQPVETLLAQPEADVMHHSE